MFKGVIQYFELQRLFEFQLWQTHQTEYLLTEENFEVHQYFYLVSRN